MFKRICSHLCLFALLCTAAPAFAQDPQQEKPKELTRQEKAEPAVPLTRQNSSVTDDDTIILPEGTEIQLSLRDSVSSKLSEAGDEIYAVVRRDVVIDGRTLLEQGTEVIGRVTLAQPAGRMLKGGKLHLSFERIRLAGGERRLIAIIKSASDFERDEKVTSDGEGTLKGGKDGGKVLTNMGTAAGIAGAATGIIIFAGARGAINSAINGTGTGIGKGALIGGGAVLGGAIIASILLTKGKEIRLDENAIIRLKLERPLAVERYN
jgi:hypothetical protein